MNPRSDQIERKTEPVRQILLGDHQIKLPEGLTVTDWTIEKIRWQNPRIRSFLGCTALLDEVLESNYAILHCSPERLQEIWRKVRKVGELIRTEMAPLMKTESRFPALEEARQRAELALDLLSRTVLADLERFLSPFPEGQVLEVRKLLCVSIGKLHAFLQDALGEIMAKDPRSLHDADYFLSRRFPRDLEEAEWLFATVSRLFDYLQAMERDRWRRLGTMVEIVEQEQTLPVGRDWIETMAFLEELVDILTPKLKEVLALRGIRFYEMEIIDRYAVAIPTQCRVLLEIHSAGRRTAEQLKASKSASRPAQEQNVSDLLNCHAIWSGRIVDLMREIDSELRDLVAFVPIWLDGIENRRALLLKTHHGKPRNGEAAEREPPGHRLSEYTERDI